MMAGIVQNPDTMNPVRKLSAALDRRDVVLNRDGRAPTDHREQANAGQEGQLRSQEGQPTRNGCVGTPYPFLCDYVYKTLRRPPAR